MTALQVWQQNVAAAEASLFRELDQIKKGIANLNASLDEIKIRKIAEHKAMTRQLIGFDRALCRMLKGL